MTTEMLHKSGKMKKISEFEMCWWFQVQFCALFLGQRLEKRAGNHYKMA